MLIKVQQFFNKQIWERTKMMKGFTGFILLAIHILFSTKFVSPEGKLVFLTENAID